MKRGLIAVSLVVAWLMLVGVLAGVGRSAVAAPDAPARVSFTQTLILEPSRDNTLYESELGTISNGQGQHLFAGNTNNGDSRRAVLAFDLSVVPPLAEVVAATLSLNMSKTTGGETPVALHALARDWGEGASDALGEEGGGALAQANDATWLHTFFDGARWNQAGGDFDETPSAVTAVGGSGRYDWSTPALALDVQGWLDAPATSHGWIVIGNESADGTAKRFDSGENAAANRPRLVITIESEALRVLLPGVWADGN
jgi:hypothetical protein